MIPAPTGPAGDNGPPRLLLAELLKDVSPELVTAEILITATVLLRKMIKYKKINLKSSSLQQDAYLSFK